MRLMSVLVLIALSITDILGQCDSGQTLFRDSCYWLNNTINHWMNVEDECQSRSGHLTSVQNQFERNFLYGQFFRRLRIATEFLDNLKRMPIHLRVSTGLS